MVAFTTIKPGDVLYQVLRQKMGNTSMRRDAVYSVAVLSVEADHAICSWNGNPPRRWSVRDISKLRRSKPEAKPSIFDRAAALAKDPRP